MDRLDRVVGICSGKRLLSEAVVEAHAGMRGRGHSLLRTTHIPALMSRQNCCDLRHAFDLDEGVGMWHDLLIAPKGGERTEGLIIMAAAAPTLTPADLAEVLGTDARTTRKFLRSITPKDAQPGKGSRWAIKGTKGNLTDLGKKFAAFTAAEDARRAARDEAKVETPEAPQDATDEVETPLDEVDGPTDEEIADLDA